VRVEAHTRNEKGKKNGSGSLEYEFDATNFGPPPQCDPNREPKFSLERVDPPKGADDEPKGKRRSGGSGKAEIRAAGSDSDSRPAKKSSKPPPRTPGG
jgi:hypothetical protein